MVADAGLPCRVEDELSRAAAALLLGDRAPSSDELSAAVRDAGSDLVFVRALFQRGTDAGEATDWLRHLRRRADAELVCGQAQGSAGHLFVAAARGGRLDPIAPGDGVVRGALLSGFARPELVVQDAAGRLVRLGVDATRLSEGIPLASDLALPAKVQLVAHGSTGPRPVAERVYQAARPRVQAQGAPPLLVAGSQPLAASELTTLLSELRSSERRPALRDNRLLAGVALEHARKVCEQGKVAHRLEGARDPEARLRAAGIEARVVGETVARARDAASAFAAFGDSPSHLLALLEPRFTDAGIGVAHDGEGRSCVVVLLAAWPRYVGR